VGQDGGCPACQHGGRPQTLDSRALDGVDAAVQSSQATGRCPVLNPSVAKSQCAQLGDSQDAMLALGEPLDRSVGGASVTFRTYSVGKVTLAAGWAVGGLGVGWHPPILGGAGALGLARVTRV
jgi:hypothetical protein